MARRSSSSGSQNNDPGDRIPAIKRFLILIANGEFPAYKDLEPLETPLGDIKSLVGVLNDPKKSRDTFDTTLLANKTAADIFSALNQKLREANSNDLFIIYYSGHGMLNRNLELFLATHDTDGNADECNPAQRIKFDDLNGLIVNKRLTRAVIMLDCCHSAAAAKGFEPKADLAGDLAAGVRKVADRLELSDVVAQTFSIADAYEAHEIKGDTAQGNGIYLMAACEASQSALGDKKVGMGVFTKHLCDGLVSKAIVARRGGGKSLGFIPISKLFRYVSREMENASQKPVLFARNVKGGDLILTNIYRLLGPPEPSPEFKLWVQVPTFENSPPSYILEPTESHDSYCFMDWNASFDSLVATPLRLVRGMHVQKFLEHLDNWEDAVKVHSMQAFPPGKAPRVDIEELHYRSVSFGLLVFDKIASRLRDGSCRWCVTLNVRFVQRRKEFTRHMRELMERDEMWSTYADLYDPIIGEFRANKDLVRAVVNQVDGARNCLDVGAGTGNTTMQLLQMPDRKVHAIDINGKMLQHLSQKLDRPDSPPDAHARTRISHGDCLAVLAGLPEESYDACVMMNVLFALDRPVEALREIRRVLTYDGVLSLSTSQSTTDVHRLFDKIREELEDAGQWKVKEKLFASAYDRNREMIPIIVRYSQRDIERFLAKAGFEIAHEPVELYVNCVLVYKAVKKKRPAFREDAAGINSTPSDPLPPPAAVGSQDGSD